MEQATITMPVSPHIAAAWAALSPEKRTAYEQAIVEAWLEPLTKMSQEGPAFFIPYYTIVPSPARRSYAERTHP